MGAKSRSSRGRSAGASADEKRTRAELAAELAELRERLADAECKSDERRRLEESSKEQREIFESIIENLGDGVAVVDEKGKFLHFNPVAERILGMGVTDSSPERWSEVYGVFYPDRVTPFPSNDLPLYRALSGKETRDVEMFVRNPKVQDGVFITVTGTPLWRHGAVAGAVAVFRDITERRQAAEARWLRALTERQREERKQVEAELEKARDELVRQTRFSAIGQIAASIAHDLRNPLGAIRNSRFYLSRRLPPDGADWGKHLGIIEQEIHTAERIIDNLLDVSRSGTPSKELVDLGGMVRESYRHSSAESEIELELNLDPDPFPVDADPDQLRRLLGNLLTNAVQAMDGKGRVVVDARREEGWDVITVEDEGAGIPEQLRDRVFEPLFTTRAKGTGLGLSICRQIAVRHGGTIELESVADRGSIFRVRLPHESPRASH
jgi:PAS domain S-box-containing protein